MSAPLVPFTPEERLAYIKKRKEILDKAEKLYNTRVANLYKPIGCK